MMHRYRLLQPIEIAGDQLTPADHPVIALRADQAERLAAAGIIAPSAADPMPAEPTSTAALRTRGRKQEH